MSEKEVEKRAKGQ